MKTANEMENQEFDQEYFETSYNQGTTLITFEFPKLKTKLIHHGTAALNTFIPIYDYSCIRTGSN